MTLFDPVLQWFQAQPKPRQVRFIAALLFIAALTTGVLIWALSPSYGLLFSHLDTRDANPIITQLEQEHIAYQIRNHGHDILIDKRLVDKIRIKLMGNPLPLAHSVGFELFDKTDFGM